MELKDRLIVALDVDRLDRALSLVDELRTVVGYFKVGLELLTAVGAPAVVRAIHSHGGKIFFDGKFNDIPNTVGRAAAATAALGVSMFDVHASSGTQAIEAAAKAKGDSKLLVVTVLTSLDDGLSQRVFGASVRDKVEQFAREAARCGADGFICSPRELDCLRNLKELRKMWRVTPGVRPSWSDPDDQSRYLTPGEAIQKGATHLILGRPVTDPPASIGSRVEAARRVLEEMEEAGP